MHAFELLNVLQNGNCPLVPAFSTQGIIHTAIIVEPLEYPTDVLALVAIQLQLFIRC